MTTDEPGQDSQTAPTGANHELSAVVVPLLKGVVYREDNPALWASLLGVTVAVRDYVAVMGLELTVDESEGYAFLRSRHEAEEDEADRRHARGAASCQRQQGEEKDDQRDSSSHGLLSSGKIRSEQHQTRHALMCGRQDLHARIRRRVQVIRS